jgi:hypothetical protein
MTRAGDAVRSMIRVRLMPDRCRAQSHVVGAILLLGLTVVALGGLTATVGGVVDDQSSRADAARVATGLDDALRPVETTGHRRGTVRFSAGHLGVAERQLRVHESDSLLVEVDGDALVFEGGDRRVASVAGAVVRGRPGNAWLVRDPPIVAGPDAVVVGAVRLGGAGRVGGTGGVTVPLRTNVSHERTAHGAGNYSVAVETATPGVFERYAQRFDASTEVRDIDGDGTPSVVIDFDGTRLGYTVVHDLRLEVGHG